MVKRWSFPTFLYLLLGFGLLVSGGVLTGCSGSEATSDDGNEQEERKEYDGPRGWEGSSIRSPGESVNSPFEDPATAGRGGPRQESYERPYARAELKASRPLVVARSGNPPFEDPGIPPVSGTPVLSSDDASVRVPAGSFIMGLTDADPFDIQNAGRKRVSISEFAIDRFEVTNGEYRAYIDSLDDDRRPAARPDSTTWTSADVQISWRQYFYDSTYVDHPVVAITWKQARDYCAWNDQRLPTEAEWEFAARSGIVGGIFPWEGFSVQRGDGTYLANYDPGRRGKASDGHAFTAPIGSYPPNDWGLHDMSGNVAEWVMDAFTPLYKNLADFNPLHRDSNESRHVVRGGSWAANAFRLGVGFRDYQDQSEASLRIGFRCASDPARTSSRR